ncbi:MAG: MerC family mercury resistance protein [Xanthomonadaceae bacterium]|nr:MerC family mercury resistance protein [Xanthomonadaceae bacterium]
MSVITRVADKAGVVGTIVGSFGCAACFPAAATIGAAIGLGFLVQWEGLFARFLIPIFAIVALLANLAEWSPRHQWQRVLAGSVGPAMALIGAFGLMGVFGMTHGFLAANVARGTFYTGVIIMMLAALWNLVCPVNRRCQPHGFEASIKNR